MEAEKIKNVVKETYAKVLERNSGCCSSECCSEESGLAGDYSKIDGYVSEADYGLGCGIPTEFANIREGDVVLDLGSGAGNDVFIAAKIVGEKGRAIGLDMTEAMVNKANANKEKLGIENAEFILGDIESIPVREKSVDVVLSNCVLNLVPEKRKAFIEIYRVLKQGGHFTISDIIISGKLPDKVRQAAEMYAGCISGAMEKDDYLRTIRNSGFKEINIYSEKAIEISDSMLLNYVTLDELKEYRDSGRRIISITLSGTK